MDYETLGNNTKIKEMYAIGPAISVMMEGYIVKDELTSLKGTLVPATTVNKTISKNTNVRRYISWQKNW